MLLKKKKFTLDNGDAHLMAFVMNWLFFLQVAIICNHQRTVSKTHSAQMSRLTEKIEDLKVNERYWIILIRK